ncbi:unnamed protein product [Cercopithifilaria johnstoni]|uniref:Uncharacterized protein n=1 Tax=Cercopithifilaria johnstoni TaxID=2874296 RepID=A0A8J2PWY0_9BILA|nr:unnamed protein product [Cercopithifilaria johnstoni]
MADKYEDLGPANALPPPPQTPASTAGGVDRTELKSAQIDVKYTNAQKICMIISAILALTFLIIAIAMIVLLLTGIKVFS